MRDGGSYVTTVPEFWVPGGQFTADRGIEPRIVRAEPDGRTLDRLARAAEAGQLTATVAKTLALTEAADALDLLQAGGVRGKLVLVPLKDQAWPACSSGVDLRTTRRVQAPT